MTENNPNYNGMAQALNTTASAFSTITTATYENFGAKAKDVIGLTGSYTFFGSNLLNYNLLPGVSVVAAYNSADQDLKFRATVNAAVSEVIALGVEATYVNGVGKVVGILTGASADLYLNKANIDFYGWGTSKLALFGLATSDYYYVKEYQRGETTFYEAYDSGKQELHFGTEGYETTDFTTLKLDLNSNVTKVIRTDDGNRLEVDIQAKSWSLTVADGTVKSGSLLDDAINGGKVLYYADPANGGAISTIPIIDLSQLTADQFAAYVYVNSAGIEAEIDGALSFISGSPRVAVDAATVLGAGQTSVSLQ